jgi:sec-independent protein translocase protein TatA
MTPFTPTLAVLDGWTIALLAGVFIMIFGGSKLPELARGLGKARREFRKASDEVDDEIRGAIEEDERKKARSKIIEEEERARIRAKIEEEERTKLADKNKQA